jgi:aspartyl-tRNA(Asn)/glutamyl-tRNA(Gln) amidotransferase subunit C
MKNFLLSEQIVIHVAKLARIELRQEEVKKFQHQLSEILDYVNLLSEVNTSNVEPISQITGLANVTREDEPKLGLSQNACLEQAKEKKDGKFQTKSVF